MKTKSRKVRLKDVCDRITVGHVGSMKDEYVPEGISFLRSQNIHPFRLNLADIKFVTPEFHAKLKKSALKPGDVAVVRTGYPGTACVIPKSLPVSNCSDLVIISPNETELDSGYLAAVFNSSWGMATVGGNLVGAAQQHFNVGAAKEMELNLPDLPTQRKIADILSAYDDLIENNLRRIKILEEMAQSLYREWFVHFRFPGHGTVSFADSSLGRIPKGWNVKPVETVLKRLKAGTVYKKNDVSDSGDTPVIDQSTDLILGFHGNKPDHRATASSPIAIFGDHTCKMQLMTEPFSIGPNVIPFVAAGALPLFYVYFLIRDLAHTQEYKRHWIQLNSNEVAVATNEIAERFRTFVQPIFQQFESLQKQNQNLRRTRDLLLPQLLAFR